MSDISSDAGKLVYLYLKYNKRASVAEMKTSLQVPYTKLYSVLKYLESKNIIKKVSGDVYRLQDKNTKEHTE